MAANTAISSESAPGRATLERLLEENKRLKIDLGRSQKWHDKYQKLAISCTERLMKEKDERVNQHEKALQRLKALRETNGMLIREKTKAHEQNLVLRLQMLDVRQMQQQLTTRVEDLGKQVLDEQQKRLSAEQATRDAQKEIQSVRAEKAQLHQQVAQRQMQGRSESVTEPGMNNPDYHVAPDEEQNAATSQPSRLKFLDETKAELEMSKKKNIELQSELDELRGNKNLVAQLQAEIKTLKNSNQIEATTRLQAKLNELGFKVDTMESVTAFTNQINSIIKHLKDLTNLCCHFSNEVFLALELQRLHKKEIIGADWFPASDLEAMLKVYSDMAVLPTVLREALKLAGDGTKEGEGVGEEGPEQWAQLTDYRENAELVLQEYYTIEREGDVGNSEAS